MNPDFVNKMKCPSCNGDFIVKVFRSENDDIEEGTLSCNTCDRLAPIINGVPRILPPYLNRSLVARFPDYFKNHVVELPLASPSDPFDKLNQAIFNAFNFNWVAPRSMVRSISKTKPKRSGQDPLYRGDRGWFFDNVSPLDGDFFEGKIGLDAGCNVGRYSIVARENGAEMVGLEQTFAVETARRKTRGLDGVHLVQGSLFEFPFKDDVFDFAICFGVLHHTPNPEKAFRLIASSIKPGGSFLTMLYGLDEMARWYRLSHMRTLRMLTTRIPLSATRKVCEGLAAIMKYGVLLPLSAFSALPGIGAAAKRFPFVYLAKDPVISISRNFFDRLAPPVSTFHTRGEIEGWYRDANFSKVVVSRREANAWRAWGMRGS